MSKSAYTQDDFDPTGVKPIKCKLQIECTAYGMKRCNSQGFCSDEYYDEPQNAPGSTLKGTGYIYDESKNPSKKCSNDF